MRKGARGRRVFRNSNFTHLMGAGERELRTFARDVGLPEKWLLHPGTPRVHFDISGKWLNFILHYPEVTVSPLRQWVERWKVASAAAQRTSPVDKRRPGRNRMIRSKGKYALIELLRSDGFLKYSVEQQCGLFR
jgi:hypothetical protein